MEHSYTCPICGRYSLNIVANSDGELEHKCSLCNGQERIERSTALLRDNDIEMLNTLIKIANEDFDGHLTILKFTTNWRVIFGTPDTDMDSDDVSNMPCGKTFNEAAEIALAYKASVHDEEKHWLDDTGKSDFEVEE